jgi:hypothetical protein
VSDSTFNLTPIIEQFAMPAARFLDALMADDRIVRKDEIAIIRADV